MATVIGVGLGIWILGMIMNPRVWGIIFVFMVAKRISGNGGND